MSEDEKILTKVRALLAQAEDPAATPAEAELFSRKAEELIAKYGVDIAMLEAQTGTGRPIIKSFPMPEPYAKPKAALLNGIGVTHGCRVIRDRGPEGTYLRVIGFESDVELVELLYTSLLLQGTNALLHQSRGDRSFRTSYWYGFAGRVYERLEEMRKAATAASETPGTELVLASRSEKVDAFFKEQYPSVRKATRGKVRSGDGFRAGRDSADRADLGGRRVAGSTAGALA